MVVGKNKELNVQNNENPLCQCPFECGGEKKLKYRKNIYIKSKRKSVSKVASKIKRIEGFQKPALIASLFIHQ